VIASKTPIARTTPKTNPSDFLAMSPSWRRSIVPRGAFRRETGRKL
jgi:hypothetical protein